MKYSKKSAKSLKLMFFSVCCSQISQISKTLEHCWSQDRSPFPIPTPQKTIYCIYSTNAKIVSEIWKWILTLEVLGVGSGNEYSWWKGEQNFCFQINSKPHILRKKIINFIFLTTFSLISYRGIKGSFKNHILKDASCFS